MALPIPSLDDRSYEDHRKEMVDRIPLLSERWTHFNSSDSGIMIVELLSWLAEMVVYRLDQIPEAVYSNFLKMVVDRPEPVTVEVEFSRRTREPLNTLPPGVTFPAHLADKIRYETASRELVFEGVMSTYERDEILGLSADPAFAGSVAALFQKSNERLVIPAGTQLTTTQVGGEVYETVREGEIEEGKNFAELAARHREEVTGELLGVSSGKANQTFPLERKPVLLDRDRERSTVYDPNPLLTVDGKPWNYRQDLLEAGSGDEVYTVEFLTYLVKFGDGVHGKIPEQGKEIRCTRYQIVRGPEVRVLEGELTRVLEDELKGRVQVTNRQDAVGGRHLFDLSRAVTEGLKAMREQERAITPQDFEELATTKFNSLDTGSAGRVARAHARRLDDVGTTAVIVIPEAKDPSDRTPVPTKALKQKLYRFLDRRRLITTRIQVGDPQYRPVSMGFRVYHRRYAHSASLMDRILSTVNGYFHPLNGGPEGNGWPLGRGVYRSEIFHLLESILEVDFVSSVVLENEPELHFVTLKPLELPDIRIGPSDVELIRGES